jgi:hypothetical protein
MCDFEDDFDSDDFADTEMDESIDCKSENDGEPGGSESEGDEFTTKDAFFIGGAMGFAYEEGLKERKWRKRKRLSDDSE